MMCKLFSCVSLSLSHPCVYYTRAYASSSSLATTHNVVYECNSTQASSLNARVI